MRIEDLQKFAYDLRQYARLEPLVREAKPPSKLHVLTLNGVDFYFYHSEEKQYDGWGSGSPELLERLEKGELTIGERPGATEYSLGESNPNRGLRFPHAEDCPCGDCP